MYKPFGDKELLSEGTYVTLPPFGQDLGMTAFFVLALALSVIVIYWAFVIVPEDREQGLRDLLGALASSESRER